MGWGILAEGRALDRIEEVLGSNPNLRVFWSIRIMVIIPVCLSGDRCSIHLLTAIFSGVSVVGSAFGLEPKGRRFKSCTPDHLKTKGAHRPPP